MYLMSQIKYHWIKLERFIDFNMFKAETLLFLCYAKQYVDWQSIDSCQ